MFLEHLNEVFYITNDQALQKNGENASKIE